MAIKLDKMWDHRLRTDIDGALKYSNKPDRIYRQFRRDPLYLEIPDEQLLGIINEQANVVTAKDIIGGDDASEIIGLCKEILIGAREPIAYRVTIFSRPSDGGPALGGGVFESNDYSSRPFTSRKAAIATAHDTFRDFESNEKVVVTQLGGARSGATVLRLTR